MGKLRKSELQKLKEEVALLKKLSLKDPLTGFYNRRGLIEQTDRFLKMMERLKRGVQPEGEGGFNVGIIVIDVDDFKKINDQYSHKAGDEVFKRIATILEGSLRKSDIISRWGGDEFVVVIFDINKEAVTKIAARLREKISSNVFIIKNKKINITISLGAKTIPSINLDLEKEIAEADKAMYRAKKRGKNNFVVI